MRKYSKRKFRETERKAKKAASEAACHRAPLACGLLQLRLGKKTTLGTFQAPQISRKKRIPPIRSNAAHRRHPTPALASTVHYQTGCVSLRGASPEPPRKAGKEGEMHREVFGQGEGSSRQAPLAPARIPGSPARQPSSQPVPYPKHPPLARIPPQGCPRQSAYSSLDAGTLPPGMLQPGRAGTLPKWGLSPMRSRTPCVSSGSQQGHPRRGLRGDRGHRKLKPSHMHAFGAARRSYVVFPAAPVAGTSGDRGAGRGANSLGAARGESCPAVRVQGQRAHEQPGRGARMGLGKGPAHPPAPAQAAGSFRREATNENRKQTRPWTLRVRWFFFCPVLRHSAPPPLRLLPQT